MAKARVGVRKHVNAKSARRAVKVAKKSGKKYKVKRSSSPAWKKGGREWSKVLGHFGAVA